jgi:predicted TPR repeat methyltransferase
VASATGIDTSAEMLELARSKAPSAVLICGDAVADPSILDGSYDLLTAFRFFLNAGESLRRDVLAVLHDALAEDGILVFNIHSNAWSLRALSVLVRKLVLRQHWWNQLSYRAIRKELGAYGFEVVGLHGYNYLTVKGYQLLPAAVVPWLERSLSRPRLLRYLAVDLLLVCSRATGGGRA